MYLKVYTMALAAGPAAWRPRHSAGADTWFSRSMA